MCWNKGRLCWKITKLFYFCHLKKLVRPETFGPYYVLKTCHIQFSQTSSSKCVWSIPFWRAKCDITVELFNESKGLMAVILKTSVYFSWTCVLTETLKVIIIWQRLYSKLTLANEALRVARRQLEKSIVVKHPHLQQSYSLVSHLKYVLQRGRAHLKHFSVLIYSIRSP